MGAIFDAIDVNDDGELSREERQHAKAAPPNTPPCAAPRGCRALAAPQRGSSASSARAWRLRAARHSLEAAGPLGAPPPPRRSSPPVTTQELRGGLARYGALRLALGVGTYYDYKQPSSGSKPVEYRYFW